MKNNIKQIINKGDKFGLLTVIEEVDSYITNSGNKHRQFKFECNCGKIITKKLSPIREGRVVSCGCYGKVKGVKHNLANTKLYKIWTGMKQRCYNPNNKKYSIYGGKGIIVCEEWKENVENFVNWALNNGYVEGLTIDRIDGTKNYSPDNCRIVDYVTQNNNTSRNRLIEIFNETKTVTEWTRDVRCMVSLDTFVSRIKRDWIPLVALTTPKQKRK